MLELGTSSVPAGLPSWVTPEAVAETRTVFEPLYGHRLSDADVAEILIGTDRMFRLFSSTPTQSKPDVKGATDAPRRPARAPCSSSARQTNKLETP